MSYGLIAVLLLRLDAHFGEWVSVAALASHVGCPAQRLQPVLEQLAADGRDGVALHFEAGLLTQAGVFAKEPPPCA